MTTVTLPPNTTAAAVGLPRPGRHAVLTSSTVELLDGGRKLQLTGDLDLRGVRFPALPRLRVVERTDDRLLVVGTARLVVPVVLDGKRDWRVYADPAGHPFCLCRIERP